MKRNSLLLGLLLSQIVLCATAWAGDNTQRNVIFILTDDQRYDALGFMDPAIDTPNMDRMASEGVHFKNAFVTTALCSPSRASILTGQYMHTHGVVDNNQPPEDGTIFFPTYLQQAGYQTAFVGKWHMGEPRGDKSSDGPQPGFDHWVSFAGQGNYYPVTNKEGKPNVLNINGVHVPQKGYITDELTDYALDWLNSWQQDKPFFLYLSHKAVHSEFLPARRHEGQYADRELEPPASQADTPENYRGKPMWVKNQRNSWHGVDYPYHSDLDVAEYKQQYNRTLSAVDDNLGRIFDWLESKGLAENTTVMLMGDNGFLFGEHGLIDKRNAYEESMRVPLLAVAPGYLPAGKVVEELVANIDIAPTVLDMAGVEQMPKQFEGRSFLPVINGTATYTTRREFLYEYYWEFNFPHTPTTFALRTDDFKYIQYHGVWDTDELYDMREDPREMNNLVADPAHTFVVGQMRKRLYELLAQSRNGTVVPYTEKFRDGAVFRSGEGSTQAPFPEWWIK